MDIDIRLDLVPENVEALARFADLFAKPRFHRIACPGVDPHRDSDLHTLRRTMEAVLEAAARRGMAHEATPRRWGDGFTLSSDQIWHMLFGLGHLAPAHSMMCSLFMGVVPHHIGAEGLAQLSQDTARLGGHALRYDVEHEDHQLAELARFFRAMGLAAALNVSLLIDG